MVEYVLAMATAFWLGLLTAISPCPMATNIAAISYIGRKVGSTSQVLLTGWLYAAGRTLAYVGLGAILVFSVISQPQVSMFLQQRMPLFLGPILLVVALFLLDLIPLSFSTGGMSESMQKRIDTMGMWGGLLLGIVFAMAFCPTSAVLFFGSMLPVALELQSAFVIPALYGIGTAVPVIVFAVLIAFSAQTVGTAYNRLSQFEWWARRATGVIFLVVGFYFSLVHIFEVDLFGVLSRTPGSPGQSI